jgi:cardiolipin synthase
VRKERAVEAQQNAVQTTRVLTIPNLLSALRLLGVPVFLLLILSPVFGGPKYDGWALLVLALGAVTDYLDGNLARRWNQISRVGQLLDPIADRMYIFATLVGLTAREIIPLWLMLLLVARDVYLLTLGPVLYRHNLGPPPVHFLGKAATFNLLYAFPLVLLGDGTGTVATLAAIFGWAFVGWGTALYWWAAVLYTVQVRRLVQAEARAV